METRRAPRPRTPGEVEDNIRRALQEHPTWTPAQVHHHIGGDTVTSLKTVQRRHAAFHAEHSAEDLAAWTLDDGDGPLVLPTLRLGKGTPTREHARFIAKVRRACPSLTNSDEHLERAWELALRLQGRRPESVLLYMAFEPWTPEGRERWVAYVASKLPEGFSPERLRTQLKRTIEEMTPEEWAKVVEEGRS